MGTLRRSGMDLLSISKLESMMVRDLLVLMYTCYQDYIIEAIMEKVKYHSNNHKAIVHFIVNRIDHTNIETKHLSKLLGQLLPDYSSNFKPESLPPECAAAYKNIVLGRINVAHDQANNLQIRSLEEVEEAHTNAKQVLEMFRTCMWQSEPRGRT